MDNFYGKSVKIEINVDKSVGTVDNVDKNDVYCGQCGKV